MKKYVRIFFLLWLNNLDLFAQSNLTNDDGPSVEKDFIVDYQSSESPVNLSTGTFSTGFHLLDLDGGDKATLQLFIDYKGRKGMQVNDIAGPFGTGFNLKGGGFIKRILRGIPDEKNIGEASMIQVSAGQGAAVPPNPDAQNPPSWAYFYPGYFELDNLATGWIQSNNYVTLSPCHSPNYYRNINAPTGVPNWEYRVRSYYSQVYGKATNQTQAIDGEPDIFQFEFGNFRGSFVFGNDGLPVLIPYQDIKIIVPSDWDRSGGGISTNNSWIFITADGTKYEFINDQIYTEKTALQVFNPTIHGPLISSYISKWNLSTITGANGNSFTFSYENEFPINFHSTRDYIQEYVSGDQPNLTNALTLDIWTSTSVKRISQILSAFGRIDFIKSATPRLDLTNQYSILEIKKYNNQGSLQDFITFNYDSYSNTNCPNGKRLFLNSLTFENLLGGSATKKYYFKYYFDPNMPEHNSKMQDLWGFWNNNTTNNLVPSAGSYVNGGDRSISPSHSFVGMLKEIVYPTGGSKELFYEQNSFYNTSTQTNELIGGNRVNRIIEHAGFSQGNDITTLYTYNDIINTTRSSGEGILFRRLYDYQESFLPNDQTVYCLIGSIPRRELNDDWIRYKYVTIQQNGNGKKVYKLTSHSTNPDIPAECFEFNLSSTLASAYQQYYNEKDNDAGSPNTDMSYDRGLITNETFYDEAGNKVKETIYNYDFNPRGFNIKEVTALRISSVEDIFREKNDILNYNLEYYKYISKLHVLISTQNIFYDNQNNLSLTEENNYLYNLAKHPYVSEVKKTNSDGLISSKKYIYPFDISTHGTEDGHFYSSDPFTMGIWTLIDRNIVNVPLETISKIQNINGVYINGSILNMFELFDRQGQPPLVKLSKQFNLEIEEPINNFNEISINSQYSFSRDARYQLKRTYDKYDNIGNLIQESDPYDNSNSYIYCNSFSKAIAEVNNAKFSSEIVGDEVSYTGFEYGWLDADHWLDDPIINIYTSLDCHTGEKSFKILHGYGPIKEFKPSNQTQKYRFSCYIKTQNGFNSNQCILSLYSKHNNDYDLSVFPYIGDAYISIPVSDTQGEWKYVEAVIDLNRIREISGISASTLLRVRCAIRNNDLTHFVLVDDIRFQPCESELFTTSYDRISGKPESIINNNAMSSFYDYNGLNQLELISDNDHNLIQYNSNYLNNNLNPNDLNYSKSTYFTSPHTISELHNGSINTLDFIKEIIYYDGLGRPIQQNLQGSTVDFGDLIQPIVYDEFGRKNKIYLKYEDSFSNESFRANSLNDQSGFYQNAPLIEHTNLSYFEKNYDNSPQNIVTEIGAPGANWAIGSGHTVLNRILTNTTADNIIDWKILGNDVDGRNYYQQGMLYKLISIDENGNEKLIFKDKFGRIILERKSADCLANGNVLFTTDESGVLNNGVINGQSIFLDTYYIYNNFGLLFMIIPPGAINDFTNLSNWQHSIFDPLFEKYTFRYTYDSRGRCVNRKLPGQDGVNKYIYNNLNQIVLTQSPVQLSNFKWSYYKYDKLGRLVMTGIYDSNSSQSQLQNQVNSILSMFETRTLLSSSLFNYTNNSFPPVSDNNILTVKYYDNYDWDINSRIFLGFDNTSSNSLVCYGLETGSIEKVLNDGLGLNFLTTVNYFDSKARLIQVHKKHILNDWDVISNAYNYSNNIVKNIRQHKLGNNIITISTRFVYDHATRLTDVYKEIKKFDGTNTFTDNEIHQTFITYNKIGKVIKKSLHYDWAGTSAYLQDIDYRYNIRGWLTNINNSELINDNGITNSDDFDAFGESIYYNNCTSSNLATDPGVIQGIEQFNGNISAIKWKVRSPYLLPTKAIEHLYVYRYDKLNRMTAGYYASDENLRGYINTRDNLKNFDETVDYDLMGNITTLKRNNQLGQVDNLNYEYDGNRLINVIDGASLQSDFDFHDISNTNDYLFNSDGSIIQDNNKDLIINYNDLNLPNHLQHQTEELDYSYSGFGEKLKKKSGNIIHYYISGIEYEDNGDGQGAKLMFIQTEEGRIRPRSPQTIYPPQNRNFVFDYFLKDHIGNVRAVLTEEVTSRSYHATMESLNSIIENALFNNIDATRDIKPANEPPDPAYNTDLMVSKLGGSSAVKVGVAKVLKVSQGDRFDITTKYFFDNVAYSNTTYSVSDFLQQLAGTFIFGAPGLSTSIGENQLKWTQETFLNNAGINDFFTNAFQDQTINNPSEPQSYLVYLFFDDKFVFHADASGILQVKDANVLGNLGIINFKMPANGFFYVYTNNESTKRVNFNNLSIVHYAGVLLEENHYYPYGLLMEGITPMVATNGIVNKYKFTNKELQLDLGMNQYDLGARFYDPVLGRFSVIDPFTDFAADLTSYRYAFDNPVSFTDPTGLLEEDECGGGGEDNPVITIELKEVNVTATYQGSSYNRSSELEEERREYVLREVEEITEVLISTENGLEERIVSDLGGQEIDAAEGGEDAQGGGGCPNCLNPATVGQQFGGIGGLTYPGGNNPKSYNGQYNYSYVPTNLAEYSAIGHDRRYDNLKITGASGLFTDTRAIGADWRFVSEELSIAGNPFLNPIDRMSAGLLGVGLGLSALPKTLFQLSTPFGYMQTMMWYNISNQGVNNTPTIHKH